METGQQEGMTYPAEQGLLWIRHSLTLPLPTQVPFEHLQL